MIRNHRRSPVLGVLAVLALVSSACSSADDDTEDTDTEVADSTETVDENSDGTDAAAESTTGADSDGDAPDSAEGDSSDDESAGDDALQSPGESHVTEDEGQPVHGGTLVYGLEADTANPWAPYRASTATSSFIMLESVSDPLFTATADGELATMLVESYEHNDDYTEWTYQIRDGITFHDGTPLTGAAVEFNLETCKHSSLWAAQFAGVSSIDSDGQTVTLTSPVPTVALPWSTVEQGCSYMFSPDWLGSLADVPQRQEGTPVYDAELADTPADGDPAMPVGLGAFVFESYTPGNGNSFRLVRNEDYWRGPNGITGEELPYLDAIEGVVASDVDSRANGLQSGQFDIMHTSAAGTIDELMSDDELELTATSRYGETNHYMFNVGDGELDPEGVNEASPVVNVHCRRALAHATDRQRLIDELSAGLLLPANGPFPPGHMGFVADNGFPAYDPDLAVDEAETCLEELGLDTMEFSFMTVNDPAAVEAVQLAISLWQEVLGDRVNVEVVPVEQGQAVGLMLTGNYNVTTARRFPSIDPDSQGYWWHSASSAPINELSLNLGRFQDPVIDEALATIHSNPDPEARVEATQDLNRRFAEQVYNLWTSWTLWGVISQSYVNGVELNDLPDGGDGIGLAWSARHMTNQIWCDDGSCE